MNSIKNKVAILLLSYKDGPILEKQIKIFRKKGLKQICVVVEETDKDSIKRLEKLKLSSLIKIKNTNMDIALQTGLYTIDSEYIFVTFPDENFKHDELIGFLEFGIVADFPLLFGYSEAERPKKYVEVIKKRLGVFINPPDFSTMFLNKKMIQIVKCEVTGTKDIYLEIIRSAVNNKMKIGVYPRTLVSEDNTLNWKSKYVRWRNRLRWRIRIERSEKYSQSGFTRYAFPDVNSELAKREVTIAVISSILTFAITNIIYFIITKYFSVKILK